MVIPQKYTVKREEIDETMGWCGGKDAKKLIQKAISANS